MVFIMEKDMTKGSPMRLILGFSIPLIFGLLFQQLYSMVDTIIVGHYLGVNALAAVGATGSINFLINGFCIGVCSGFAIPIAQEFGAGNEKNMRKYVANSVWLATFFAVVMTILVVALCHPILRVMRTPENIIDGSYMYIVIIFMGIPVTYLYNMTSSIIRSLGDSRTPVIFLTMAAVLNIALDLVCIIVFQLGVAGAAIATVTSQAAAGICCLLFMRKKFGILRMEKEDWVRDRELMVKLCGMGLPMGLQYSITAIGSVILQSAVNGIGSDAVAAVTAGSKLGLFLTCAYDAMGSTMATYGGQNIGAGRLDRISKGLRSCVLIGAVYSVFALVIVLLFGRHMLLLFLDRGETAILENAMRFITINVCFYFPLALVNIVRFLIQGMGYSILAVFAGMSEMIARGIAGFVLVPYFGFAAVGFANPLAWIFADAFLIPAYLYVRKDMERIIYKKSHPG